MKVGGGYFFVVFLSYTHSPCLLAWKRLECGHHVGLLEAGFQKLATVSRENNTTGSCDFWL